MKWKSNLGKGIIKGIATAYVLLFTYAATSKLLDFETFTVQLAQSPLLSAYAGIITWLVPGIEIVIAVLLIFKRFREIALYAAFALMVMFTAYIFIILNFSDFIPCSCGGVLEKLSWTQHLIFNIVFILLAGVALLLSNHYTNNKKLLLLATLALIGISIVALLFAFSEKKMHRNNAFVRRYMPHPIEKLEEHDLKFNSYYLAGFHENKIYLANYKIPLLIKVVDINLKSTSDLSISVSNSQLPFRKIRIVVNPPYFYLGDGTVPVLFRGRMIEGHAAQLFDKAYYTKFTVADSVTIGIVTVSSKTKANALGLLQKKNNSDSIIINENLLTKQVDGVFDSDGSLLWNAKHKEFLYVYRYRNTYEVATKNMTKLYTGKTIDTIKTAIIDINYDNSNHQSKLGYKSVEVNKASATGGDYLYIESDRLGKYEDASNTSTIIDVYNIINNSYEFSFYIYHNPGKKLREFMIDGNMLVALIDETLLLYRLKPEYFNSGSN